MHDFSDRKRIGEPILYMLSEYDVRVIIQERRGAGYATHHGNDPHEGSIYPGVIVGDWGGSANLQVWLDGTDTFWPTSRSPFDPEKSGQNRYYLPDDGDREITLEEYQKIAGPNDVGAGDAARVAIEFEPDARGHWITA